MATLSASTQQVHADGTALLTYQGTPNRTVVWTLLGSGTLTPLSPVTDPTGMAGAVYTPGRVGDVVTIEVQAGA